MVFRPFRRDRHALAGAALACGLALDPSSSHSQSGPGPPEFNRDIRPILSQHCFECHGPDAARRRPSGEPLRLDDPASALADRGGFAAFTPGNPPSSEALRRIRSTDPGDRMPPPEKKLPISSDESGLLEDWIAAGAHYQRHWSFIPPTRPALPPVRDSSPVLNAIDAFVQSRLEQADLEPAPEEDPGALLRRVSLDLTGLPPSPAELQAFSGNPSTFAYHKAVQRYLASPRFGERMTVFWLDAARYADTDGYQNDAERTMWPWRDWVIAAYNANMPYDQFTVEQLAGDLLPDATEHQRLASAFNRNHRLNGEGGALPEEYIVEYAVDRVETTAAVWLGLTIGCARCHDHKYDPVSQEEFYSLYAYFNSIAEAGTGAGTEAPPLLKAASPLSAQNPLAARTSALQTRLREIERSLPAALEHGVDRSSHPEIRRLESEIASLESRIAGSKVSVMIMQETDRPTPTYLLRGGQYDQPDMSRKISRGIPLALDDGSVPQPAGRLELARWLVSPRHPLTARVTVNRIWSQFFGSGLVETAEDFGSQGSWPSHPELLDWLAVEFIESGWNVKHLIETILGSAAYRRSSSASPALWKQDPKNRLLARGPRFRLDATALRDQALALSGLLLEKPGGPPVKPYQPPGLWNDVNQNKDFHYLPGTGEELYRRSLYTYWKRAVAPPLHVIFDASGRETCNVHIRVTNTPLQALALMNDETFTEAARHFAERILREGGPTLSSRLAWGHRAATGRLPEPAAGAVLTGNYEFYLRYFGEHPLEMRAFLATGSSPPSDSDDPTALAALTAVAHLMLNLDCTLTR